MNQRIDLDGVSIEKLEDGSLTVRHHKTNTVAAFSASALVRWLLRQLRGLF